MVKLLTDAVEEGLREQFNGVMARKKLNKDDVGAGQWHIGAYVEYIHHIEPVYEATRDPAHGHYHGKAP